MGEGKRTDTWGVGEDCDEASPLYHLALTLEDGRGYKALFALNNHGRHVTQALQHKSECQGHHLIVSRD